MPCRVARTAGGGAVRGPISFPEGGRWWLRTWCLFVVKRINRIEVGGLASRVVAEEDSNRS